jgi:hypothetical protein
LHVCGVLVVRGSCAQTGPLARRKSERASRIQPCAERSAPYQEVSALPCVIWLREGVPSFVSVLSQQRPLPSTKPPAFALAFGALRPRAVAGGRNPDFQKFWNECEKKGLTRNGREVRLGYDTPSGWDFRKRQDSTINISERRLTTGTTDVIPLKSVWTIRL